MLDTVPKRITPRLKQFCRTLSTHAPRFIKSRPSTDAVQGHCFDSVERKIARAGGGIEHGWAIWHLPSFYFEAEHHGVWRKRSGELIDVSPQINGTRTILFLPDPEAIYDPARFRSNVIQAESQDLPEAVELVASMNRRNEIQDRHRSNGAMFAQFSAADHDEVSRLLGIVERILGKHFQV